MTATAKGAQLQRIAKAILESMGARVEMAQNVVRWIKRRPNFGGRSGMEAPKLSPISTHHDLFGVFDLLVIWPEGGRNFYQVTVLEEVSRRRRKILDLYPEPLFSGDAILGWKGGRDRHFRVFRGPTFENWTGECFRPMKKPKSLKGIDPDFTGAESSAAYLTRRWHSDEAEKK